MKWMKRFWAWLQFNGGDERLWDGRAETLKRSEIK